jgi:hypothetical protein
MKFLKNAICLSFLLLLVGYTFAQHNGLQLKKVIIIRHAEKPANGDNLSCKGLNRALELPDLLKKKIGIPDYVFVPSINTGKNTSTARMYQTIVPFAVKYNLNINSKYDVNDTEDLAKDILKRSGTILIVWEHDHIDNIAKALGVQNTSKWPGNDFDSIWIIEFQGGKAILKNDKEGLNPSADCK